MVWGFGICCSLGSIYGGIDGEERRVIRADMCLVFSFLNGGVDDLHCNGQLITAPDSVST